MTEIDIKNEWEKKKTDIVFDIFINSPAFNLMFGARAVRAGPEPELHRDTAPAQPK
jgi:hypothetical protein